MVILILMFIALAPLCVYFIQTWGLVILGIIVFSAVNSMNTAKKKAQWDDPDKW